MRADLAREKELVDRKRASEREIIEQQELKRQEDLIKESDRIRKEKECELIMLQKDSKLKELGVEPEVGTKNSVALQIRLPDGKQINRRFMENNLVKVFY